MRLKLVGELGFEPRPTASEAKEFLDLNLRFELKPLQKEDFYLK